MASNYGISHGASHAFHTHHCVGLSINVCIQKHVYYWPLVLFTVIHFNQCYAVYNANIMNVCSISLSEPRILVLINSTDNCIF